MLPLRYPKLKQRKITTERDKAIPIRLKVAKIRNHMDGT